MTDAPTKPPLQIFDLPWYVCITEYYMEVGSKILTHAEWPPFDGDCK